MTTTTEELEQMLGLTPSAPREPVTQDPAVQRAMMGHALGNIERTEAEAVQRAEAPTMVEDNGMVAMIDRDGNLGSIPKAAVEDAMAAGFSLATPEGNRAVSLREKYGDKPVETFLRGAASTATLGLTDLVRSATPEGREAAEAEAEFNPIARGVGEAAGYLLPIGAGATVARGAGAAVAEKAASSAAIKGLSGGGLLARAAARAGTSAARMGTEGAVFGLGEGISDAALAKDPMSAEAIVGELGSHVLLGTGLGSVAGGGLSLAGSALGYAAGKATKVLARATERLQAELKAGTEVLSTTDDALRAEVMAMERPALEAAVKSETATLQAQRLAEGKVLAKDLEAFYHENRNNLFKLRQQLPDKALKKDAIQATEAFKKVLGDLESLAEEPVTALKPLRRLEQQLGSMQKYLPEGSMQPSLDGVNALKNRVADLSGNVSSERLTAMSERLEHLVQGPAKTPILDGVTKSIGATVGGTLGAATGIPYAGMAGAWLGKEFSDVLKPMMKRVLGSFVEHAGGIDDAAGKFLSRLGTPTPTGQALERLATASSIAGGSAYARATKAVTDAATDMQATEAKLDQQLAGLAHAAPQTALQVKQGLLAKIAFLAGKVPKTTLGAFGSALEPSDAERSTFARYVAAADDPLRIVKELRAQMVMPETVETAQALYPRHLERLKAAITEQLADTSVRAKVPYGTRLAIAEIVGSQVDPTLDPAFVAQMQAPRVPPFSAPNTDPDPTSAQRLMTHQ